MTLPKFKPEQWVIYDIDSKGESVGFGKIVGGWLVDSEWYYIVERGQDKKQTVHESWIINRLIDGSWRPLDDSGRIRA